MEEAQRNVIARVLVADGERGTRESLRRTLILDGYEVQMAESGIGTLELIARGAPDAVVLGTGSPDLDAFEVCRRLRLSGDRVPILILSARDAVNDRISGLDAGADDCMLKPFDVNELRARLRALLRRPELEPVDHGLTFAGIELDEARHGVALGDRFAELTRTEYKLLELFMLNPQRVMSRDYIYSRVWDHELGGTSNALGVYVGYLRRKLATIGARPLIKTVVRVGYVLREP